jgi:hypothetical protein
MIIIFKIIYFWSYWWKCSNGRLGGLAGVHDLLYDNMIAYVLNCLHHSLGYFHEILHILLYTDHTKKTLISMTYDIDDIGPIFCSWSCLWFQWLVISMLYDITDLMTSRPISWLLRGEMASALVGGARRRRDRCSTAFGIRVAGVESCSQVGHSFKSY